jgi:hypothetical protein
MARMNPGTAAPRTERNCTTRSTQPPYRAAVTPSTTLRMAVSVIVMMMSDRVTGIRVESASVTDWPVRKEAPRSPCTTPDR